MWLSADIADLVYRPLTVSEGGFMTTTKTHVMEVRFQVDR
jgi:hypothetical protein